MKKLFISVLAIAATAIIVPVSHNSVVTGASPIPDFSALLPDCTTNNWAKPCYFPDSGNTDSGSAWLGECSNSVTNFCYTATVNGQPAPSKFKIVASVGAYKTNTPSESIAGYEAYIHAFAHIQMMHIQTGLVPVYKTDQSHQQVWANVGFARI